MRTWKKIRKNISIRWYRFRNFFANIWYWIRSHTYKRYHIVDVRGQAGFSYGWVDRDHLLLLACFKILVDFVEQERDDLLSEGVREPTVDNHGYDDTHFREADREILSLYNYWKYDRAKMEAEMYDFKKYTQEERFQLMDIFEQTEETNLLRLIKVRGYMWT